MCVQQIKSAERYLKKLEFHLAKVSVRFCFCLSFVCIHVMSKYCIFRSGVLGTTFLSCRNRCISRDFLVVVSDVVVINSVGKSSFRNVSTTIHSHNNKKGGGGGGGMYSETPLR